MRCSTTILARGPLARPRCIPQVWRSSALSLLAPVKRPPFHPFRWGVPAPPETHPDHRDRRWSATKGICRPWNPASGAFAPLNPRPWTYAALEPAPCFRAWRRPKRLRALLHASQKASAAFQFTTAIPSAASETESLRVSPGSSLDCRNMPFPNLSGDKAADWRFRIWLN